MSIKKMFCALVLLVLLVLAVPSVEAQDVDLAGSSYGGSAYITTKSRYANTATSAAEIADYNLDKNNGGLLGVTTDNFVWDVFDGDKNSGARGLGSKNNTDYGWQKIVRYWGQEVTINAVELNQGYRFWNPGSSFEGWQANPNLEYRDSSGNWQPVADLDGGNAPLTGATYVPTGNGYWRDWKGTALSAGGSITTDAIRVSLLSKSNSVINNISVMGPSVTAASLVNIAQASYLNANAGMSYTSAGSTSATYPVENFIDGDNNTHWRSDTSGNLTIDWGEDMALTSIQISGFGGRYGNKTGVNGDIEINTGTSASPVWVNVQDGSSGFDGFWKNEASSGYGGSGSTSTKLESGGFYYGTSAHANAAITASGIRLVNMATSVGSNHAREFIVMGAIPFDPADLNMDGFVDGLDLGILLGNWGTTTSPNMGELDGTPPVDGLDLGILLGAWNPPPLSGVTAVPEPGSLALALIGGLTALRRRRNGGQQ